MRALQADGCRVLSLEDQEAGARVAAVRLAPPLPVDQGIVLDLLFASSGIELDLPGALRVIHMPGHTPGSVAFHTPAHDALFVGDALVTDAVISERRGPQISPFAADPDLALASLANIEQLEAHWLLPGHGSAWTSGVATAVAAARDVGIEHLARPKR